LTSLSPQAFVSIAFEDSSCWAWQYIGSAMAHTSISMVLGFRIILTLLQDTGMVILLSL
jgi:hypothetical protein